MTNTATRDLTRMRGEREAAKKTQTNREADSEEKEELCTKQTRRRGELKTRELVTGYPRPVSHFTGTSLHRSLLKLICSSVPSQIHHS